MILDSIKEPRDIKKLSSQQLQKLAGEIRELIIRTVADTGGHLAPNLGVVELTLAIHKIYDTPRDKIIWDVGHQAYVHKILTGRCNSFHTLRKKGGISGFPKIAESRHDAFGTGHSSTSISAALGMALARDLSGDKYQVLAVIGDGSLTGGQAYEALNHAGHLGTDITVILNDNEMSIAKNVGAMSEYLAKMRTAPAYSKVKQDIEYLLRRIPAIGDSVAKSAERVKSSLKYLFVPGMLFEELGFTYIGPIDGHNLESVADVLETAKHMKGPVLIHTLTNKGMGYKPAEENAGKFHGIAPFCIDTGEVLTCNASPTYTQVFGDTLVELADQNQDIVAITAAMPEGTGLKKFAKKFPNRFFDVGIAEPHASTIAAGLAANGKKPVVAIYSTFMQRAYDQLIHDIALQKLPVVFALDRAGVVGEDGATHQGVFDLSFLRHIPNLTVMAPKDEAELRQMLYTAINMDKPAVIRYPRGCGLGVPTNGTLSDIALGKAEELCTGTDVAIVAIGSMVAPSVEASAILKQHGINAGVVNARFAAPIDQEMLRKLAREVGVIVTVEDNVLAGGFGSAVLEAVNDSSFNWVKVLRLGYPDTFIEQGTRAQILEEHCLDAKGIAQKIRSFMHRFGAR